MPRYDDSPRDRSPIESRRERNRIKSPSERRRGRESPISVSSRGAPLSSRDPYDDYPKVKSERESAAYKILCISNLNHKASDNAIRDALSREFSRFNEVSVKVCHDENERIAYIYFRSYDDAREARHTKSRLILFEKSVEIEPIYDHSRSMVSNSSSTSRRRSVSPGYPPPTRSGVRGPPSPLTSSRRAPPPPPPPSSQIRNNLDKHGGPQVYSRNNNLSHSDMHSRDVHNRNEYHHHHHNTGYNNNNNNNNTDCYYYNCSYFQII